MTEWGAKDGFQLDELISGGKLKRKLDDDPLCDGIAVFCGDGDRDCGGALHQTGMTWCHRLAWNGGPLPLANSFPAHDHEALQVFWGQIYASAQMKHRQEAVFAGHWPCGAGMAAELDLEQTVNMVAEASRDARQNGLIVKAVLIVHLPHGDEVYEILD